MTFLFIIGPGLPAQGAQLSSDPKSTPVEYMNISSFSWTLTQPVNNWTLTWPTHETINLEPSNWTLPWGDYVYNYQVFAVNQPVDYFNLTEPGVEYATRNTFTSMAIHYGDGISLYRTCRNSLYFQRHKRRISKPD